MLLVTNRPSETQGGQNYLDGSYRCKHARGAHGYSRGFVGWTDNVVKMWRGRFVGGHIVNAWF